MNDNMWKMMELSGEESGEIMWRMPMFPGYKKQLKSNVADLRNVGNGSAGSCVAAVFLKEFVSISEWMHMDIAGVDHSDESTGYVPKGMTGKPVSSYPILQNVSWVGWILILILESKQRTGNSLKNIE